MVEWFDKYGVATRVGDKVWIKGDVVADQDFCIKGDDSDYAIVSVDVGSDIVDIDSASIERYTPCWQFIVLWNDPRLLAGKRFFDYHLDRQGLSLQLWKLTIYTGKA